MAQTHIIASRQLPTTPPQPVAAPPPQAEILVRRPLPTDEGLFHQWYAPRAQKWGLDPDPDNPAHFYDYRAAFRAGAEPDEGGHWPSEFKRAGHPRTIVEGIDTRTGQRVTSPEFTGAEPPRLVPDQRRQAASAQATELWKATTPAAQMPPMAEFEGVPVFGPGASQVVSGVKSLVREVPRNIARALAGTSLTPTPATMTAASDVLEGAFTLMMPAFLAAGIAAPIKTLTSLVGA